VATYGEAWVDLHVKSDKIEPETDRALHKMGKDAESTLEDIGEDFGDDMSRGISKKLEGHGRDFVDSVRKGIKGRKIKATETVEFDRDNNVVRRWVKTVTTDIEEAFSEAGRPGGPINKIGSGIADAIGAGFNVSGRSSLILLLIPLIGVIVGLVGAALQAINALAAALTTLPALLASIGLQVGVLFAAFHGLGGAISGAFAAKNAKELTAALKGLTPEAQKFVRSLLPLKDLGKQLATIAQSNFFRAFGADVIPRLQKILGPTLINGFAQLARIMGQLFRDLALFFGSPSFVRFINNVIPSTVKWLANFGPSFITFLGGLVDLANASLPFLQALGQMLSGTLFQLGEFFSRAARDPKTAKWFKDMQKTMEDVLELFGQATAFVVAFLASLNEGGGPALIQALADAFEQLAFFFGSPVGQEALEGLADLAIFSIKLFVGLVETIGLLLAALEAVGEFINVAVLDWKNVLLGFAILLGIMGAGIYNFFKYIGGGIRDLFTLIGSIIHAQIDLAIGLLQHLYQWFRDLGKNAYRVIQDTFKDVGNWIYDKGKKLVRGFVDGMLSMLGFIINAGHAIGSAVSHAIAQYIPHSPAEMGPFSGSGAPKLRGQKLVKDFAEGIRMQAPELQNTSNEMVSNIVFGPGAIKVGFEGAVPTEQQARTTGSAVGSGILDKLAARNTRLAVRTL
jgi:hypothetical protein